MNRFINWLLGGLAVGVAVRALGSRRDTAPVATASLAEPAAAEPRLPTVEAEAARRWYRHDRVQTAMSFSSELAQELKRDNVSLMAASLSYYAMLAIFPALIATVSIYALVLDPDRLASTIESFTTVFPAEIVTIIDAQLQEIVNAPSGGLTIGAVVSIVATLWTASGGTRSLIRGLNIAYDVEEHRPFLIQRGIAYGMTISLIVFVVAAVALVTGLPTWLGLGDTAKSAIEILRWPGLFMVVVLGLGLLYKTAPNRPSGRSRWLNIGAFTAAILWVAVTLGFSFYVTNLGSFNATYGALSGVIVLMLWFFISGFVILLGAEVNAVLEHRRMRARRRG